MPPLREVPSLRPMAQKIMVSLSAAASPFCRPEEDPFLLLESTLRSIELVLMLRRNLPLRRTWSEQPYGEEEIIHAQCIPSGLEVRSLACRRMGPVPTRSCLRRSGARVM